MSSECEEERFVKEFKEIQVLFLAHYAPRSKYDKVPSGIYDEVYAIYHHKVFTELSAIFPNLISSNNVSTILDTDTKVDYIFSLYNRMPFRNSEIFVSSVAEYLRIPYLGATPNIRALAEDKHLAKMLARYLKVPTPAWKIYNIGDMVCEPYFAPPYFVKPRFGAASKFINENSICDTWEHAYNQIQVLFKHNIDVILEQQIKGVYHTSPVLNNFNSPLLLPCVSQHSTHCGGVVTHEQKRKIESGLTREILNDKIISNTIHQYSRLLFDQIQPLDYTRFDYIVDDTGVPYFLEFNVCCNLGEHSTISQAAQSLGISYTELIENITYSSLYRNNLIDESFGKNF